jgi:hypothetical protein
MEDWFLVVTALKSRPKDISSFHVAFMVLCVLTVCRWPKGPVRTGVQAWFYSSTTAGTLKALLVVHLDYLPCQAGRRSAFTSGRGVQFIFYKSGLVSFSSVARRMRAERHWS